MWFKKCSQIWKILENLIEFVDFTFLWIKKRSGIKKEYKKENINTKHEEEKTKKTMQENIIKRSFLENSNPKIETIAPEPNLYECP